IPTTCPFCKTKINPELTYDLKLNSMLKNLYERLTTYFGTPMKEHRISIRIKNFYPVFMMFMLSPYKKAIYKQNYSDALGWLKQMLKFKPKSYTIRCVMAIIYWKIGLKEKDQKIASQNHSKALNILTEAIRLCPKKTLAYMYRSQIYMFFQNNYCASMDLNEVLSNNPNNTIALLYKAKIYVDEREFDYARQEFEKINAKHSGQSILSTLLPKLNRPNKWMLFGPEKSLPVQLYSLDNFTVIAYVLFKIWRSLYRPKGRKYIKELELAISNCRQAIKNNCRNIVALAIKGNSNFNKKFFNDAFNDFNEILKILPNNQIVLIWRGKTNRFLGNNQESLEDLNNAIHQSSLEKSQTDLRRAIELNPEEPYWHCQYGALLYKQNHDIESLHQLNIAIKSNPKYKFEYALKSEAHYFKGMVYKKMGHSEMANMDVEKAMGHFEMANMDFETAIELDPNNELAIEEYKDKIQLIT
ncbi:31499_t:CDS:2, partial [Gigaspora margarita]